VPRQPVPTAASQPLREIGTKAEPVARQPAEASAGKILFAPLEMNIKGLDDKKEEKKGSE
jgi:hypothetical protein